MPDSRPVSRNETSRIRANLDRGLAPNIAEAQMVERTRMALLVALDEAIDLAAEGWDYASPYFREKWKYEERIAGLRGVLEAFDDR